MRLISSELDKSMSHRRIQYLLDQDFQYYNIPTEYLECNTARFTSWMAIVSIACMKLDIKASPYHQENLVENLIEKYKDTSLTELASLVCMQRRTFIQFFDKLRECRRLRLPYIISIGVAKRLLLLMPESVRDGAHNILSEFKLQESVHKKQSKFGLVWET